jgi:periplasmic divalent cation tolerance protein
MSFSIALVTAPDLKTARMLSKFALEKKLVACANLIPKLESHYWWDGKIEKGLEILILFKTTARNVSKLERLILEKHPYDTPEFLVIDIKSGTKRYLEWIHSSTK